MKQNLQKQIIMTLLAALALFGTGLSCGGGEKADVTLQMWKPFDSTDKWQDIISAYGEYRAGVKIVYTQKPAYFISKSGEGAVLKTENVGPFSRGHGIE